MKNFNPEFVTAGVDSEQEGELTSQTGSFYDFKEDIYIKIGYADYIKQFSNDLEDLLIVLPHVEDDLQGDPIIMKIKPYKNWIYL